MYPNVATQLDLTTEYLSDDGDGKSKSHKNLLTNVGGVGGQRFYFWTYGTHKQENLIENFQKSEKLSINCGEPSISSRG